jgi:four helix bundle protein
VDVKIMQNAKFKMQKFDYVKDSFGMENLKLKMEKNNFKSEFNKRLIKFSLQVIKFCEQIRKDRNLWPIADQLLRSATSIGANVIEAKASSSKLDYLRFFQIALKSANETNYWLILISESNINLKEKANYLIREVEEIAKIIGAGILTMKGKR